MLKLLQLSGASQVISQFCPRAMCSLQPVITLTLLDLHCQAGMTTPSTGGTNLVVNGMKKILSGCLVQNYLAIGIQLISRTGYFKFLNARNLSLKNIEVK